MNTPTVEKRGMEIGWQSEIGMIKFRSTMIVESNVDMGFGGHIQQSVCGI